MLSVPAANLTILQKYVLSPLDSYSLSSERRTAQSLRLRAILFVKENDKEKKKGPKGIVRVGDTYIRNRDPEAPFQDVQAKSPDPRLSQLFQPASTGMPSGSRSRLTDLEQRIHAHIVNSQADFNSYFPARSRFIHVIKYLPPSRIPAFQKDSRMFASSTSGFTWGDGVYVAPLGMPLTTRMYGRAGIVGVLDPSVAKVYDATSPSGIQLYQSWIRYQIQWYRLLTTTVHSDTANRYLRNRFRQRFKIDCVFFRPDQWCRSYINRGADVWAVVTHWTADQARRVASGYAGEVKNCRWCVIGAEEFESQSNRMIYKALLGPQVMRSMKRLTDVTHPKPIEDEILDAYVTGTIAVVDF